MNSIDFLHLLLFSIINIFVFEIIMYFNLLHKLKSLKEELKSSFVFFFDKFKTDEEKEKIAVNIGFRILISVSKLIIFLLFVLILLWFLNFFYKPLYTFIISYEALIFSFFLLSIYYFFRIKLYVR